MKRVIICVFMFSVFFSCQVDVERILVNEKGSISDTHEFIPVAESERSIRVEFGLSSDDDIQTYSSDSLYSRLKYGLGVYYPVLPAIKLNSFSFTNKKGDTIPSIIYYRTVDNDAYIIDSLPVTFINDIKKQMRHGLFEIFAECSQSYFATEMIYVNYDIEIGDKRFEKKIKYRRKRYMDWRPKFW